MEYSPLGDRAVTITLGNRIDETTRLRIQSLCALLDAEPVPGMVEYLPAFASLTVYYDPAAVPGTHYDSASPYERFCVALKEAFKRVSHEPVSESRLVEIPVLYGGEHGPDINDVAMHTGLGVDEIIRLHSGASYVVHMVGFVAGFGYLGGLPPELATPRRSAPRTRVPASSVGIGGSQTGVYPIDAPGGWNLIGRTSLRLFDPLRDPATLLRTGDRVRFVAVDAAAFARLAR